MTCQFLTVAVRCSVLQCVAVTCQFSSASRVQSQQERDVSVFDCCSVLQRVAACCSVLQSVLERKSSAKSSFSFAKCKARVHSVCLRCVAVFVAVRVLQFVLPCVAVTCQFWSASRVQSRAFRAQSAKLERKGTLKGTHTGTRASPAKATYPQKSPISDT